MDCPDEFQYRGWLPEEALQRWLKFCGRHVRIYRGARILNPEHVEIGDWTQIDEAVHIFGGGGTRIGRRVHFSFSSSISGGGVCIVGDFASIGAGARLVTGTDLPDGLTNPTAPPEFRTVLRGRVEIQAHAIIYTNCIVFPDVTIGEGAVVSAGSIVHRDLKPWAVYGGNPLVQIGVRSSKHVLEKARLC